MMRCEKSYRISRSVLVDNIERMQALLGFYKGIRCSLQALYDYGPADWEGQQILEVSKEIEAIDELLGQNRTILTRLDSAWKDAKSQ